MENCIVAKGKPDKDGYGRVGGEGAHRYAYRKAHGLPKSAIRGLIVMHSCDNRACVNAAHLFLGTQQDNIDDMIAKGRKHIAHGNNSPHHKLTQEQADYIVKSRLTQEELATKFGVSQSTVSRIKSGHIWR